MPKKTILFIDGIPDDRKVRVRKIEQDGTLRWRGSGSANLVSFLQSDLFGRSNIVFDTNRDQELPKQMIHAVFNQISDPDTHKITLQKADEFYKHIPKHIPFFNIPSQVMKTTRDNIYRLLQGIDKLHVPKTVKIQPKSPADIYEVIKKEGFSFPVIFRQAGDHGGISTIRVNDETEQFYAFALDGRDYYLTQFVEYANEEGIYAKYRLVVVDGEVYIRHVIFSDSWIIHSESRTFMERNKHYQQAEKDTFKTFDKQIKPKIQPMIKEVYDRVKLDYFGIDCAIDEAFDVILFEANANMNILLNNAKSKDNIWTKQIDMIIRAIIKMILKR
ncbi:MAG TPA: hypothetical protein CFH81_08180 [Sulfurovum sp. UBA12169]|nr:MAG TPA: hypothetical protein CFH81_08180 [Sulfurovum sp. UBA12169]